MVATKRPFRYKNGRFVALGIRSPSKLAVASSENITHPPQSI